MKFKICWTSQQGTEHSIFRVILWNRFEVITTMFVQSTTFITDFYKFQSSYSPTSSHGEPERKKKKMLNLATGNRAQHIQSYLFLKYKVLLPQRLPVESQEKKKKKPCWTLQQGTEHSIFRVTFWNRFKVISLQWLCKVPQFFFY